MELALFYGEIPEEQRKEAAGELHQRILGDAGRVMYALCDLCEHLKIMRDQKLYREMGLDSFERYVEEQVGIKARQAYNYISTYEKLGRRSLQSNAHLGITKLALLAEVPDIKRADFEEANDLEGMSVREIKELVARSKGQAEQITMLQDAVEKAGEAALSAELRAKDAEKSLEEMEREYSDAVTRAGEAARRIRELEERPIEVVGITEEEKQRIIGEMEARYLEEKARAEERIRELEERPVPVIHIEQQEREKLLEAAEKDKQQALEQLRREQEAGLETLEKEKTRLEQELEAAKKGKDSGGEIVDGIMREANVWFESWMAAFGKIRSKVSDLQALDPERAGKIREIIRSQMQKMMEGI